ncbi:MAG TPA: FlgD immunoglobulin-like domain containing protein [Candidatus Cloacimonadota bacterium]|nr:FlgD immunoglobulin-like domain containing protein [Candidatus Cloacimonadota bacterium]
MKKLSLIFVLALAVVAGVAQTQFTATYTFGTGGNVQSFAYNGSPIGGINPGPMVKQGVTTVSSDGNFRASGWPTDPWSDTGKYIGFTISAKPGYKFTINTITFGIGRNADGTRYTEWRGSNNNYGSSSVLTSYTVVPGITYHSSGLYAKMLENPDLDYGWTGIGITIPAIAAYQNVTTSCGFRMYMCGAETSSGTAGLQGPITITGTYSYIPSVEVSTTQLTGFTYQQGSGPSPAQSFTVTASGLYANHSVLVTALGGYEVSLTENGDYKTMLNVLSDGNGNVASTPVYVRLDPGLFADTYNCFVTAGYYAAIQGSSPPENFNIEKTIDCFGTVTQSPEYYVAFEKDYETKTYIGSGTVLLGTNELNGGLTYGLNWNMTDALIGTNSDNVINGKRSARLNGLGSMTMTQDKPNGAGLVSFCYRRYGTDNQVAWKVEYSTDQGTSWTQIGSTFTAIQPPNPRVIETFSANINKSRPVRIRIVRASTGGSTTDNQLNIDCIRVTHYYDFPAGVDKTVGNDQITVTGGNANYSIINTQTSPVPNSSNFTPSFHHCLTLLGSGPWTFSVTNQNANWIAYKQGDTWTTSPMTNGSGSITVPASRSTEIELLTGNGNDPTLPVTLSHFSATLTAQNYVQLTWVSQTETNLLGYNVYRGASAELSSAEKISELIGATNTSSPQTYIYLDKDVDQDGTYYYWLQNVDMDGTMGYHGPVSVVFTIGGNGGAPAIPSFTRLENAFPNPFNPSTTINYQLESAGLVKIDIYNTRGQILRSFEHRHAEAGHYGFLWDGRDSSGRELPSGVYLLKMRSGTYVGSKKVVLQK